jgi:hypothetical protein
MDGGIKMIMNRKKIEQKLVQMSKEQAIGDWTKLKAQLPENAGTANLSGKSNQPLYKRTRFPALVAAAVIIMAGITLLVSQLLPAPAINRLEPGQTINLKNGQIIVNTMTRTDPRIGMPPDADYLDLTLADLPDLFGRAPIPALPAEFKPDSETFSAIIFRTGSVFMMNGISFSTDPQNQKAARIVFDLNDKGELPLTDCIFGNEQVSTLAGVEMMIGAEVITGDEGQFEQYTAQFVANNIGYRIRSSNMSADDFLAIVESIARG